MNLIHSLKTAYSNIQAPQAGMSKKPPQPSKDEDLRAFRTITTMLSYIQSTTSTRSSANSESEAPKRTEKEEDRKILNVLDALSAILIREHEVTAVVASPYDGYRGSIQVFASVVYQGNAAEPFLQSNEVPSEPGVHNFWSRFTVGVNTRNHPINKHTDSLMNSTSFPTIGDHEKIVPVELVNAAKENVPLLDLFLKTCWGKESFDTHVWMLKTLLRSSADSESQKKHRDPFLLYIIAVSFKKMNRRMTNDRISVPYNACLLKLKTFPFINLPVTKRDRDRNHDKRFIGVIPKLAKLAKTNIPNLLLAANLEAIEIYNESTYMEFHLLLCELLTRFSSSLAKLTTIKADSETKIISDALTEVNIFGSYLRTMVRSSALEIHLQTIAPLLVVDGKKSWTPDSEEEIVDLADFQRLKPYSMRKGKALLPWESYRDWLKLLVHYFDAAKVLTEHFNTELPTGSAISITILTPPLPLATPSKTTMLPWTDLLATEQFFPTLPGELSGQNLIGFLQVELEGITGDKRELDDITNVKNSALQLKEKLESLADLPGPTDSEAILTEIEDLSQAAGKCPTVDQRVVKDILALKSLKPQDRPTKMEDIVDILSTWLNGAKFYASLKAGALRIGDRFSGRYHCEAYIASLLALFSCSGSKECVDDLKKSLKSLSQSQQMKDLLEKMKGCRSIIGVSKRCCPVCAFLLRQLNKHCGTEFLVSDEHSNISACALPEWLPGDIVHLMVVEFSRRLREGLSNHLTDNKDKRGRARTSDTGRISLDSIRSLNTEGPSDDVEDDEVVAFNKPA